MGENPKREGAGSVRITDRKVLHGVEILPQPPIPAPPGGGGVGRGRRGGVHLKKRFSTMQQMDFIVGQMVEITEGEARSLAHAARQMDIEAEEQAAGWFHRYLKAHRHSHDVIRIILERSHAT